MRLPKNKSERKMFIESNTDSHVQSIIELQEKYSIEIEDMYYSKDLGVWCILLDSAYLEFETKLEMLQYLDETYSALPPKQKANA